MYQCASNVILPRSIIIDSNRKIIRDRNAVAGTFEDILNIQIKTIKDSDGPDEYALGIRFKGSKKILRICQETNYEDIFEIADEISEMAMIPIEKTS